MVNKFGGKDIQDLIYSREMSELVEEIAEIEHNQWMRWSKELAEKELLTNARLKRWKKLWKPHNELTEEQKDQDRAEGIYLVPAFNKFYEIMEKEAKK